MGANIAPLTHGVRDDRFSAARLSLLGAVAPTADKTEHVGQNGQAKLVPIGQPHASKDAPVESVSSANDPRTRLDAGEQLAPGEGEPPEPSRA